MLENKQRLSLKHQFLTRGKPGWMLTRPQRELLGRCYAAGQRELGLLRPEGFGSMENRFGSSRPRRGTKKRPGDCPPWMT